MSQTRPSARQQLETCWIPFLTLSCVYPLSYVLWFILPGKRHWWSSGTGFWARRGKPGIIPTISPRGDIPLSSLWNFSSFISRPGFPHRLKPLKPVENHCRMFGHPLYPCTGPLVLAYKTQPMYSIPLTVHCELQLQDSKPPQILQTCPLVLYTLQFLAYNPHLHP